MSEFVALNASPSTDSKTHALAACAIEVAGGGRLFDLSTLDAEGLLGRRETADVSTAMEQIRMARVLFIATPIYRATYSGLLKVLFDQFEQRALADVVCVLAATGGSHHHFLALDTGLRPLVTSLAGISVPTAIYAISTDFDSDGAPVEALRAQIVKALGEAEAVARAISPS
jgi:FMN reductase